MAKIGSTLNELYNYLSSIESKTTSKNLPILCYNLRTTNYRGQTCKLVAGYNVQHYLFTKKSNSNPPLPLYKDHKHKDSLRHRAKQIVNSKVGEIYGPKQFKQVFDLDGFETNSFRIENRDICFNFIKDAITHGLPVISFFDVLARLEEDKSEGVPILADGEFEHAAVIFGYHIVNENSINLFIAQWGEYHEVSFDDLFESTSQLCDIKQPEHFAKFKPVPVLFEKPFWIETNQANKLADFIQNPLVRLGYKAIGQFWPSNIRDSTPPQDESGSLRSIFTIITGDNIVQLRNYFLDEYNDYLVNSNQNERKLI